MSVKDEGQGYNVESVLGGAQEIDALEAIRNRAALGSPLGLRVILNCVDRIQFEGQGATIHMGKFKEAGQLFVISEDGVDTVEEPSEDDMPNPFAGLAPLDAPTGKINPFELPPGPRGDG